WEAHECLSPDEFFHLYLPEKRQIFVADDAFGSTEYDPTRAHDWSYSLDRILRRLDNKHWLIWTARKHILEIALDRMRLQGKGENFPEPGTVLVDVGSLTTTEKAMMLYRHAKAANLRDGARQLVKQYAEFIVQNRHFTPERIRRFVSTSLTRLVECFESGHLNIETLKAKIDMEIREPTKSLKQAFECLPQEHKRFLISRLDVSKKGFFIDNSDFISSYKRHIPRDSHKSYDKIEKDLLLSFLRETRYDEGWIHPSIRDLDIDYLTTMDTERHNFLSACSTSGVSLALSVGGGEKGDRSFPLVVDEHDMEAIKSRVNVLILELPAERFSDLLKITYEAIRRCGE
ncbi:hypothetical protein KA005_19985, partial [bacterium]|nr:hypothetical protein [bacterium]